MNTTPQPPDGSQPARPTGIRPSPGPADSYPHAHTDCSRSRCSPQSSDSGITLSFGYADHDPKPHGVRIAIAAPPTVRAQGRGRARSMPNRAASTSCARPAPGPRPIAFARSRPRQPSSSPPRGPVTIVTAGAEGVLQQQALTAALTAASAVDASCREAARRRPASEWRPRRASRASCSASGCSFRACSAASASSCSACACGCGGASPPRRCLRCSSPAPACLAIDTILGALTGATAALIGIGFLGALSFVLFVAALQARRRPSRHRTGGRRVHLRRQRHIRRVSADRLPPGRLPSNRPVASEQRDRPGSTRRRLLQRA